MADVDRALLESLVPQADATIAVHQVVDADPVTTFNAARELDFLSVRSPLLVASMWVRMLPARLLGKPMDPPPRIALAAGFALPGWRVLGTRPSRELVFGAVGRFWRPVIEWRDVPAGEFADFAEPGWGKIGANFSMLPQAQQRTLLTYECRTVVEGRSSKRWFRWYWWLVRPFVAHVLRATVRTIAANAEVAAVAARTSRRPPHSLTG